jgi:putative transcription antitermination factor YqgF
MIERILSVDWGQKYLGLAYGSSEGKTFNVVPLKEIKTSSWQVAVADIISKAKELKITKLVIGDPKNERGEETIISLEVKRFKGFLERRLSVPVILVNEYYSTRESGGSHSVAASIILSEYLNGENEISRPRAT